jgi:hypothetical protein
MQQALEALNRSDYLGWQLNIPIIKALRERLAKEDDPIVGTKTWFNEEGKIVQQELKRSEVYKDEPQDIGGHRFNAARVAAQREWQGLTGDEVNEFASGCHLGKSVQSAIRSAEAKLKEKNT